MLLASANFSQQATIDTLRTSPIVEGSLLGDLAFDAKQREIRDAKDKHFKSMTSGPSQKPKQASNYGQQHKKQDEATKT